MKILIKKEIIKFIFIIIRIKYYGLKKKIINYYNFCLNIIILFNLCMNNKLL